MAGSSVQGRVDQPHQVPVTWWGHTWRLLLMLTASAVVWLPVSERQAERTGALVALDLGLGLVAFVLVFWRRRHPVGVAVVISLMSAVSGTAGGPAVLALASLATHRHWRQLVLVGSLSFAAAQLYSTTQPADPRESMWLLLAANAIATAAVMGWGMYVGSRRELLWTLRQRAERAEAEQELRTAQARTTERSRIAREMHDVLAHRITQVAMHAGALAYRDDLDAAALRSGAGAIQQQAHEALRDLRGVLGVLRDTSGEPTTRPQPTYADLPGLVDQAREDGLNVTLLVDLDETGAGDLGGLGALGDPVSAAAGGLPDQVGRTVYRIVQEGLTNVRKHAPGATLQIRLSGGPGAGVRLHLDNPLGFGSGTPGAGLGLVGLRERAELLGGRLEHRRERDRFVVETWMPWAA